MWNFDPGGMEPTCNDLPLMSNIKDIQVKHYLLDLKVNLSDKFFTGSTTFYLEQPHIGVKSTEGVRYSRLPAKGVPNNDTLSHSGDPDEFMNGDYSQDSKRDNAADPDDIQIISSVSSLPSQDSQGGEQIQKNRCEEEAAPLGQKASSTSCRTPMVSSKQGESESSSTCFSELEASHCSHEDFVFILDCCDIDVQSVEEVVFDKSSCRENSDVKSPLNSGTSSDALQQISQVEAYEPCLEPVTADWTCTAGKLLQDNLHFQSSDFESRRNRFLSCQTMEGNPVEFEVQPWCIRIWKSGVRSPSDFPAIIRINYKTRPCGRSVTWAVDQDGSPCVFTQGAWINNRSLFPCQEPPGAMATWQAIIRAPEELTVLMSGDEEGKVLQRENGLLSTLHFTDMLQPSSIVTIGIGKWRCHRVPLSLPENESEANKAGQLYPSVNHKVEPQRETQSQCSHEEWPCRIGRCDQPVIPSRILAPPSILGAAVAEFASYLPRCLRAVFQLLGAHPFSRLDLLILPRCFASLGLASPSIIFLSQSLLSGDGHFLPRLAHEISHSWFGILIGARDWTEEWLSEGFATFMEDPVYALTQNWTSKKYQDHSDLRALLRFQTLKVELENTESELQIMRPMADETGAGSGRDGGELGFVKNGLNPDKWFLQVHYLKGYFLLRHIASHLSLEKTLGFINLYVHRCHGQLVLSRDIFRLLFEEYPELSENGITMETMYSDWLDKPGMPSNLNPEIFCHGNDLIAEVKAEYDRWLSVEASHLKVRSGKAKRRKLMATETAPSATLCPDQLILLLEYLLDAETMATKTLEELNMAYHLSHQNAEVRHRWCELVVKHKYAAAYTDVRHFLLEDQAMGVYLYGELMASEDRIQQTLARDCFKSVAKEIDRGCYRTVHEMVYGEAAEREDH